jgi:hypothetical protein
MSSRYVLLYTPVDNVAEVAPTHFPAHVARAQEFHRQGTCLSLGTFGDVQRHGAMAIFTTREAAEDFVAGDPFVLEGVVARHEIREYDDVFAT